MIILAIYTRENASKMKKR